MLSPIPGQPQGSLTQGDTSPHPGWAGDQGDASVPTQHPISPLIPTYCSISSSGEDRRIGHSVSS